MEKIRIEEHASRPRCPYCHGDVKDGAWECPGCGTVHHADCARENGSCTVLGCRRTFAGTGVAPAPRGRQLPPVGSPRRDFIVGVVFTLIGAGGVVAASVSADQSADAIIAAFYLTPVLLIGMLTMGYALWRKRRENRWER